ncbi:MAG TPA: helix-turn-helix transcriptional regulator [Streptosporangiaceae bacterium]
MMTPAGITTPKPKAETRSARAVRLQGEAKALEEQGMRRSDIARQLGVGTSFVSKWLNGSQH